jgi:hypothetical protein
MAEERILGTTKPSSRHESLHFRRRIRRHQVPSADRAEQKLMHGRDDQCRKPPSRRGDWFGNDTGGGGVNDRGDRQGNDIDEQWDDGVRRGLDRGRVQVHPAWGEEHEPVQQEQEGTAAAVER